MLNTKAKNTHPKSTKKQRDLSKGKPVRMACPYCGKAMQLRNGDAVYKDNRFKRKVYVCSGYPACDTYVRTQDGTLNPMGTPANSELRRLRYDAHQVFDQMWQETRMGKESAYRWLANVTGIPEDAAHIGNFREQMCNIVIKESSDALKSFREMHRDELR